MKWLGILILVAMCNSWTYIKASCNETTDPYKHYNETIESLNNAEEARVMFINLVENKSNVFIVTQPMACGARRGCTWGIYQSLDDNKYCYLGYFTGSPKILESKQSGFFDFEVVFRGDVFQGSYLRTYSYDLVHREYRISKEQELSAPVESECETEEC